MPAPIPPNPAFELNPIAMAIKALYGVAKGLNDFLDGHIEDMKRSDNSTISRTGRVIDGAMTGFGIGYVIPVTIIAAGQFLLGNTFSAVTTVATAAILSNPIAMTCGAVGAIIYGWNALSDVEREEILDKLTKGLAIGIELVKSIIRFVIDEAKALLSSDNLREMKAFVSSAAATFGRTLGDITKKISDVATDTFKVVRKKSGEAAGKAADIASDAYDTMKETAGKAADLASETYGSVKETAGKASDSVKKKLRKPASKKQ